MLARLATSLLMAVLMSLLALPPAAQAQRSFDDDRYRSGYDENDRGGGRDVAGEFDYYALVMSWSPTYCADQSGGDYDPQCDRTDGRRYAFVLHGLWPQYERGFPGNCRTRRKPFVPQPLIDAMLDIMPSPRLVIHEYRKHGTCSGLEPAGYYELARRLFKSIKIPERYVNPFEAQFVAPGELEEDLTEANAQLKPDMLAVSCGGPGSRLREVRICFTKSGELRSCGQNEEQRRLCSAQKMFVPPVRSTKSEPDTAEERDKFKSPGIRRPRLIEGIR
jgi:ribonuclease T2